MAASSNADGSPERSVPLKTLKTELPSPDSDELSDGIQFHSDLSAPNRFCPLNISISTLAAQGGPASGSNTTSSSCSAGFTVCRGMSWTPAETNALIAVWGNERLAEARMQQLEVAGTVFSGKAPGPAMYERVSRALAELGYDRTPSQCRERMKTLRRCYSRVKEHGIGKRKSSYSIEQLEKVFGQGGWDSQTCQPVLINSSGLYQEMESDSSTMEDYPQEDWCSQDLSAAFQEGQIKAEEIQLPKNQVLQLSPEDSAHAQRQEAMQNVMQILESVDVKWEHFQTWTDFSRLHLSNKLAIFGIGYNTRWQEKIRYHYAEISSQVPLGKRLREYFNPEKTEGRVILTKIQKMNWKNVYYKYLDITISEARCLELHMQVTWIPVEQTSGSGYSNGSLYLLPGGIPKTYGLYAVGYEEKTETSTLSPENTDFSDDMLERELGESEKRKRTSAKVTYCYLGIAEEQTLQQCLFQHFQCSGRLCSQPESSAINRFLQENCSKDGGFSSGMDIYIKFIDVELDFLSAGSLVECLETAVGYSLKFNQTDAF